MGKGSVFSSYTVQAGWRMHTVQAGWRMHLGVLTVACMQDCNGEEHDAKRSQYEAQKMAKSRMSATERKASGSTMSRACPCQ